MNRLKITLCVCLMAMGATAQQVTKMEQGIVLNNGNVHARVQFLTNDIARIEKSPTGEYRKSKSVVVTLSPKTVKTSFTESVSSVTVASSDVKIVMDKTTGRIEYFDMQGNSLLKEKSNDFVRRTKGSDQNAYTAGQTFTLDADEAIYGLGILQENKLNKRGTSRYMLQSNTEDYVPVVQSVKGWGIYWDNLSPTNFSDNQDGMTFR